jgi:hypothetical protein
VYNIDNVDGSITVEAIGPAGPVAVASLSEIPLPAGSVITIDLTDPDVLGRELVVTATNRVFIERSLPRGTDAAGADLEGRSGSWALPSSST